MVALPLLTPVTSPPCVIVATVAPELDQPTEDPEIVPVLPSEYLAVAVSCCVQVAEIVAALGVMKIEPIEGLIKKPSQPAPVRHRRIAMPVASIKRCLLLTSRRTLPADASFDCILPDTWY